MSKFNLIDLNILFIDDNISIREQFQTLLKRRFKVVNIASNGEEGFLKYQELKPDIIITDVTMPKCSGLNLTKKIREIDSSTEIILFTAVEESISESEIEKLNILYVVKKPYKKSDIETILKLSLKIREKREKNI